MANKNITMTSDADFDEKVLKSEKPVLVDFFADWCGPCKMIAPFLEELADEFAGKVKIAKLNVDQNVAVATKYGIRAMPTLILFENGEQKELLVGADPGKIRSIVAKAA